LSSEYSRPGKGVDTNQIGQKQFRQKTATGLIPTYNPCEKKKENESQREETSYVEVSIVSPGSKNYLHSSVALPPHVAAMGGAERVDSSTDDLRTSSQLGTKGLTTTGEPHGQESVRVTRGA